MERVRESWAKVGGVTAIACLVAGIYFGCLRVLYPGGGFVRDLLGVAGVGLVGAILSAAFGRRARRSYYGVLAFVVVLLVSWFLTLKFWLKDQLAEALLSVQYSLNCAKPDWQSYPPIVENRKEAENWRRY